MVKSLTGNLVVIWEYGTEGSPYGQKSFWKMVNWIGLSWLGFTAENIWQTWEQPVKKVKRNKRGRGSNISAMNSVWGRNGVRFTCRIQPFKYGY
jgi:hypothetical protein